MYDTISLVVGSGLTGVVPPGPGEGLIRAWGLGRGGREGGRDLFLISFPHFKTPKIPPEKLP